MNQTQALTAWISVKDALPPAVRGVSYKASMTDVVLVRHSDRPDYPITAHAVVGEGLGSGIAIPTLGASEHPEIAWYSAGCDLKNPFVLRDDDYERYLPRVFGLKITHWKPIDVAQEALAQEQEPVCYKHGDEPKRGCAWCDKQPAQPEPVANMGTYQHKCSNVTAHRGPSFVCQKARHGVGQNSYCKDCTCPEVLNTAPPQQKPVAWVEVKCTHTGPYEFHGKELLPVGKHDLYIAPQS